ncbi:hypothetical protein B0T16DRAFT_383238 [Cercophora newfieldiana]|uniref:C3H1-type domain-containing protein n=1 Tax=Cercophora newfieldiana TaxID=92897 RepID=A0AA39XSQ3_9PEZI|nr:hypothetical protein B0T16DRAFT_383238 [Cercophora newfieldiana]
MSSGYDDYDPAQSYLHPLHNFQQLTVARASVEHNLQAAYEDLIIKFRAKCAECDREQRNAMVWEKEHRFAERELRALKADAESSQFAYVIVDGDGAIFREDLIARGEEGGGAAAQALLAEIQAHFKESSTNYSRLDVFVQVILSLEGLSKALITTGTLKNTDERTILPQFARGFCREQPLFSFVDVGWGKEQADHKVREVFKVMEKNIHCRALVLAGCHDNGYATFLQSYRNSRKITLLETTPAAADFRKLPFERISFPQIFRSKPLLSAPPGFSLPILSQQNSFSSPSTPSASYAVPASPVAKASSPAASPFKQEPKKENGVAARPGSWAAVGRAASAAQIIDISSSAKKSAKERAFYQINKDNERVDVPLPKLDPAAKEAFEEKTRINGANFCNRFHLQGSCKQFDITGQCSYIHGERFGPAEQLILKSRARGLPCASGSQCQDIWCTSGHHCSNPKSCWFNKDCRFSDTHGMDIKPTMKIYEDGSREVVV